MPLTAFAVVVPNNVAPAGFVPSAIVTALVAVRTVFPEPSRMATWTAG